MGYVKSYMALLCLEAVRDSTLYWSFSVNMLGSLVLAGCAKSHFCLNISGVHTSLECRHIWKSYKYWEQIPTRVEDFLVAGFVTSFLHPQIPTPCLSFYSFKLTGSKTHQTPGHLKCHQQQKRSSSYKFVVLRFSREFLPWNGIARGTSFHKGDFGNTTPSACRHFSP